VYKAILVNRLIDDGRTLLDQLDINQVPVRAAVWAYQSDKMAWKLVIVTDAAHQPGPLGAYMQIQKAMMGFSFELQLGDIIVMSPNSRAFQDFRRTMEGVARRALATGGRSRKNVSFEDAYIYRWPED
jgi:hypothetical protein